MITILTTTGPRTAAAKTGRRLCQEGVGSDNPSHAAKGHVDNLRNSNKGTEMEQKGNDSGWLHLNRAHGIGFLK